MAFNGNISAVQGSDISSILFTDTSTGTDANLTGRTIYLYKIDNTLLTGVSIPWPLSDGSTKTISVLPRDYSLSIVVTWQSSAPLGSPSTYTITAIKTFTGNTSDFI